ncbi:amino acid transporter AVT1F-like isoform X2 [Acanthaster planci]|uniref:Amino acid transporter AVT1F-like isoform X2 n=1 Tax=Acanthaster planci TaxID=133434 RepID=A0A8B7XVR5_ACAPL|nr:amino acid transporter AVT1F-like isoform X2 [Acanthaster planci]
MEVNGGPAPAKQGADDDQTIPLQKYRTTLYMNSDQGPEKLQTTGPRHEGLNFQQTIFLIAGYCPGFAATIMMVAIVNTGWVGFLVFAALIFLLAYAAILLGSCWNMVRVAWFEDLNPYGAIAYEACGTWARHTVNVLVDLASFGGGTVMLLATSELILVVIGPQLYGTYCYWPLIIGAIMCPAIWVGMPKHFWLLGALSIVTTLLAILLIFIDAAIYLHGNGRALAEFQPPIESWAFGKLIGATIFLLGGHFVYPEIQRAMKEPGNFDRSALTTFLLIVVFLFPTLLVVFVTYGDIIAPNDIDLEAGLLSVLPRGALVVIPGLLLLISSASVMLIIINPLFSHLEEVLNIQEGINWKRILLRTSVIILIVFLAETVNEFALLVTVVGGVVFPLLTFLAPAVSYLRLRSMHMPDSFSERPKMHIFESIVSFLLILVTPVTVIAVLAITIVALTNDQTGYVKPCYVQYNATSVEWANDTLPTNATWANDTLPTNATWANGSSLTTVAM